MQLRALKTNEFKQLYYLMKEESFPDVPNTFDEAKNCFDECLCYGQFSDKGQLMAAFIFGDLTAENAFVDIVCAKKFRGRWANKRTIKWLFRHVFYDMGLNYVWVNPRNEISAKLCAGLGFKHVHGLQPSNLATLVLSKYNATKYL